MSQGWRNLKAREDQGRKLAADYWRRGYEDGFELLRCKSLQADYQVGWREGRSARLASRIFTP